MMLREISRNRVIDLNTIDSQASDPFISIVQLDVSQKESSTDSHSYSEHQFTPLSIDVHLKTEYDFLSTIYEAQLYKNASTCAENARQRFEHYQEMHYLSRTLHARSLEAQKNLQRLQQRAQEAGFTQLACACVGNPGEACGEEGCSVDVVDRFMLQLDEVDEVCALESRWTHCRSHSV